MARVLLYTGKGGVGKTSMAAATALRCSRRGLRTIVLSTDPAHSLGDSFDMTLSPEPLPVAPNLWAQESDVYFNVEKYWGTVQRWIESVLTWEGIDTLMAEEMAVLPGMDELASLLWILEHQRTGQYDVMCDIHPGMQALVVATPGPLATIADEQGAFQIADVPAGSYKVAVTFEGRTDAPHTRTGRYP